MNLLKTPHQKMLEEAGASPLQTPGMLNTPKQMLFQESGLMPKFAKGGNKKLKKAEQNLSPAQMKAAMIVNEKTPSAQLIMQKVALLINQCQSYIQLLLTI